ncbi:MAG: ATP-dependent helicase C-terminal domain-containing protein [bacterium]
MAAEVLAAAAAADPARAFGFGPEDERFLARLRWLAARRPDLPDLDALRPGAPSPLLITLCTGCRSFTDLRRLPLVATLRGLLGRDAAQALDRHAPPTLTLPDGTSARIEYGDPAEPPSSPAASSSSSAWPPPRRRRARAPAPARPEQPPRPDHP